MNMKNVKGFLLGVVTALLLIAGPGLAESGKPGNMAAEGRKYSARQFVSFTGDSPHVVPAAAFVSDGFLPDSSFFPFGGGYFQGDSQNYGCMEAPVYLPDGAVVGELFASVYDNDPNRGISLAFRRVNNFAGGTDTLASVSTTAVDAMPAIQVLSDNTIQFPEIFFPDQSYYLTTCLGSDLLRLYSVRLNLTYSVNLPAALKVAAP